MPDPSPAATKLRPIIFGRLCLLERISVGGMAEVYRAKPFHTPNFGRLLAVKRILPNLAEDQEFIQMFVDEAKIAIRLAHPNIAQIYELGKRGNSHYIVMEYVAGHDLLGIRNRMKRRKLRMSPTQAAYIVQSVAKALGHAHDQKDDDGEPLGIVHRDISPQNVLVSYAGEVKLIDFGIAKVAKRSTQTQVGVLKGKFSYMSPEQVAGRPVDHRADLFSLGTLFHELLTYRRLFTADSDFETLERVREARVEPPSSFNDAVPWQLDNIALKALTRDPNRRYQSAHEIAGDIESYLESLSDRYDRLKLSDWMVEHFSRELALEHKRRELYKAFVVPEDVQAHNERLVDELRRSLGAPEVDEGEPELDDDEITQVSASAYEELQDELEESELEKGEAEEVIAGYEVDALAKLLSEESDRILASIDLPEPREPDEPPAELFEPHQARTGRRFVIVPLVLIALAVAGFFIARSYGDTNREAAPVSGVIILETTPSEDLMIFLDGRLVATETPAELGGLAPGEHSLEIRHAGHQVHQEIFTVERGQEVNASIALQPLSQGEGRLTLSLSPPDAEVFVDREALVGVGAERDLMLTGRHTHLIEVRRPGFFVGEMEVTLDPGEYRTIEIELRPVSGTLILRSDPAGTAYLDDIERGSTAGGLTIEGLDPTVVHHLTIEPNRVGFRPYETSVVFDATQELNLFPTLPRIGDPRPVEEVAIGFLAVAGGVDWFHVRIDGRDTGQTTPISADAPLALRAGIREVSLVRGATELSGRVDIRPGETAVVECRTQEWACHE